MNTVEAASPGFHLGLAASIGLDRRKYSLPLGGGAAGRMAGRQGTIGLPPVTDLPNLTAIFEKSKPE